MGGEIIAEKFALLKTRGSNGISNTHFVEDTLLGQRAVVKISDKLDDMGLDYLKTFNLTVEAAIPGLLVPFEGGILDEEAGYYLAFPELGEPSLGNYLRMGAPLSCGEILRIGGKILYILESLHGAGFCHLFINTRNVFYRPRGEVTLKDPALKPEYFHSFLELVATPDFSCFTPAVMDGESPGTGSDLYALGRLVERLLEYASDAGDSGDEPSVRWLAWRCMSAGGGGTAGDAGEIRREFERVKSTAAKSPVNSGAPSCRAPVECGMIRHRSPRVERPLRGRKNAKKGAVRMALALSLVILACAAAAYVLTAGGEGAPAMARGGGSMAGEEVSMRALLGIRESPDAAYPEGERDDSTDVMGAGMMGSPASEEAGAGISAGGGQQEGASTSQSEPVPTAVLSPAPPVASFSVSPAEGQSPLQVYIDASASYDPDGHIVSFAWSCGGGGESFYHVFESNVIPVVVSITLTVTDDGGNSVQATHYVTLY